MISFVRYKYIFRSRSLTDRTQDSDSCNVGSIPAGCTLIPGLRLGFFLCYRKLLRNVPNW